MEGVNIGTVFALYISLTFNGSCVYPCVTLLAMEKKAYQPHILTVEVEDYFHVGAFHKVIDRNYLYRFETRLEQNTLKTLDLLDFFGIQATFFVLGCVADEIPGIIREIINRGHEVASKGYNHRSILQMSPAEFRADLRKSKYAIEKVSKREVLGHRMAHGWLRQEDFWVFSVLKEEGFSYDSSLCPLFGKFSAYPQCQFSHDIETPYGDIFEVPISSMAIGPWYLPIGGGNYLRQLPYWFMKKSFHRWTEMYNHPFVMYFQIWNLDENQPRIQTTSFLTRIRHYRNLEKTRWILEGFFKEMDFIGIERCFDIQPSNTVREWVKPVESQKRLPLEVNDRKDAAKSQLEIATQEVTLAIPCYNEEFVLPYLAKTLQRLQESLGHLYNFYFIFVDDASQDNTWRSLNEIYGEMPECSLIRHSANKGVAEAILTGIRAARTEIVCSIDCDCSYNPQQVERMIPMLTQGVDLVTASPYHHDGEVRNVPIWRLSLSYGLSALYRCILNNKLATYTSCFRVYRRSKVRDLTLSEGGFLGVAEMIGLLDVRRQKIAECPAILEARLLGYSKMKLIHTILGHIGMLFHLLFLRIKRKIQIQHEKIMRQG